VRALICLAIWFSIAAIAVAFAQVAPHGSRILRSREEMSIAAQT